MNPYGKCECCGAQLGDGKQGYTTLERHEFEPFAGTNIDGDGRVEADFNPFATRE